MPVTHGVAGSSPVQTAKIILQFGGFFVLPTVSFNTLNFLNKIEIPFPSYRLSLLVLYFTFVFFNLFLCYLYKQHILFKCNLITNSLKCSIIFEKGVILQSLRRVDMTWPKSGYLNMSDRFRLFFLKQLANNFLIKNIS